MYIYLLLIPLIPISLIKTYTYLSYVSIAGVVSGMLGGLMLVGFCSKIISDHTEVTEEIKVIDFTQMLGYVGLAIFVIERNAIIVNLRHQADNKRKYPIILYLALLGVMAWYLIFATISYFAYKSTIFDYIAFNLVPLNTFVIITNVFFCINALTSYPVQILCVFEIIEEK